MAWQCIFVAVDQFDGFYLRICTCDCVYVHVRELVTVSFVSLVLSC